MRVITNDIIPGQQNVGARVRTENQREFEKIYDGFDCHRVP